MFPYCLSFQRLFAACVATATLFSAAAAQNSAAPDARFKAVRSLLEDHVADGKIAGAVALVIERGQTVFQHTAGFSDVAAQRRMQNDTLFRIASMTKPITSTAVMMLAEEGKLAVTDPVSKFIPEFKNVTVIVPGSSGPAKPADREITIHDLLTHTSGITYGFFGQEPQAELYGKAGVSDGLIETPFLLEENVRRIASCPLVASPGNVWQYGLSTDVLGRVIEVASGKRFDEFLTERIFTPLKMNDTFFHVPPDKRSRLATVYRPGTDGGIEAIGDGPQQVGPARFSVTYPISDDHKYLSGGAGLVSSTPDYARFLQMLLGQGELDGVRLLKPETIEQMTRNQIGDLSILFTIHGDKFGYGFGVHSEKSERSGASIGTYSWGGFFHTYFWVDPKREVIGLVMTQIYPFGHLTLWKDYQQRVYDALDRSVTAAPAAGPQPGEVYREFALHNGGNRNWRVTDPNAADPRSWQFLPNPVLEMKVGDLRHAVRAEALLDRWGGHPKTTAKRLRFNGREWLMIPPIATTPAGREAYYYSEDNPVFEVPLEHLRTGVNTVEGSCSALGDFRWGQWGLYSLILRVYYDPSQVAAPEGTITSPAAGTNLGADPTIRLACSSDVDRADVLAWYDGDDEDGNGVFREWHSANFQPERGAAADISGHVGTATGPPFDLRWDTTWVPDQAPEEIKLIARIRNRDGLWTVSRPVERLTLTRGDRSVKSYPAADLPEQFGVRVGQTKSCSIPIPNGAPLDRAGAAVLSLRTWHGWDGAHRPLRLNGVSFPIGGKNHHYDHDRLPVEVAQLKTGDNRFEIGSDTEHHMLEVLWPGPVLLVRYEKRDGLPRKVLEQYALTNAGNAQRGRRIFEDSTKTKCVGCHRVGGKGGLTGPDLSSIGGKFGRPHLIESLLEPSRQIVEGYRTSTIAMEDGRVLSGIVREQSEKALTLYDADGKKHIVPVAKIDRRAVSDVSIMPDNVAKMLSQEQFTDLIAYLETLRPGGKPKYGGGVNGPVALPEGFEIETVATGLTGATALEAAPDGRIFLCEQTGTLRVVENGRLLDEPVLTLPVEAYWERGLIGVTLDPQFPKRPYIYVCWVSGSPYPHHIISRFTLHGNRADPKSELRLLEGDDQTKIGGKVPAGHQGGALHFGPDGKLYVAIGEQTAGAPAQRLDALSGKILRLNPDGGIPQDNPFVNETKGKYRAIWLRGCRNPFTFAFRRRDGLMLINDVGGKFEEINVGRAGGNYGWPVADHGPRPEDKFLDPIYWYPQSSIAGGDFVPDGGGWPARFRGHYLFADFVHGWIKNLDPDRPSDVQEFASGLRRPVDLRIAADGGLYVLLRNAWVIDDKFEPRTGSLVKIRPPAAK